MYVDGKLMTGGYVLRYVEEECRDGLSSAFKQIKMATRSKKEKAIVKELGRNQSQKDLAILMCVGNGSQVNGDRAVIAVGMVEVRIEL